MSDPLCSFQEAIAAGHHHAVQRIGEDRGAWCVEVVELDGKKYALPPGCDIKLTGFPGSGQVRLVCAPVTGQPLYDKFVYTQAPGVAMIVWGKDPNTGVYKLAYLSQVRPLAHDPEQPEGGERMVFGQIPMGFLNAAERQLPLQEGLEAAARRETLEETGATARSVVIPSPSVCWTDPTFITNGTHVAFVEVDLTSLRTSSGDQSEHEQILLVEFLPVREVLARIRRGRTNDGVVHHMGLSLAPLMLFFAHHPEMLAASVS